ncbi:MAG TPA: hypothetical protein VKV96_12610 [Roseiarcus sp.]|nr:hypothetical protein [Roseiarcus sp.]
MGRSLLGRELGLELSLRRYDYGYPYVAEYDYGYPYYGNACAPYWNGYAYVYPDRLACAAGGVVINTPLISFGVY